MVLDAWLPVGYPLPDGSTSRMALYVGAGWQILEAKDGRRVLVAQEELAERWIDAGLLAEGALAPLEFGTQRLRCLSSGPSQVLCPVESGRAPGSKSEALAFALALKATREIDAESPLQDALYVERFSRLLPTYSITPRTDDDLVLGFWLTGGANVSAAAFRRLHQTLSWWNPLHLKDVVEAAGFEVGEIVPGERRSRSNPRTAEALPAEDREIAAERGSSRTFELPGRPELERFINEHVVDIIQHRGRYRALGIGFPSAIVLHGPPGTGKTFAIERLVSFLGWPSFQIDASSVARPYLHETSRKVAEVFEKAMENAPAVLVIDEMEAFLAERDAGSGHHRVEEVAEFLRRIPEATKNEVLIIAMTNRIDMIDPAILRRGRFDHLVEVGYASEEEVRSLLDTLLSSLPKADQVDAVPLARQLAGRPLSDVAFVVREAARLAARGGKDLLDQESLAAALSAAPARARDGEQQQRRIGFI
jgi:cell division protease FtsH